MMGLINILIVDDHPAVGEGTRAIIESEYDMTADVLTESDKITGVLKNGKYEVYLIDLYMPRINGIELTKVILQYDPEAVILIYTGFDLISHYNLLIEAGVSGFISKTATKEQLITAIKCSLREEAVIPLQLLKQLRRVDTRPLTYEEQRNLGDIILSSKEQEILDRVSKGLTNKAIAIELSMSQRTVEYNLTKIFSKLGVGSRTEALIKAREFGLLSKNSVNHE
ncbi:response regulator transcription factor [Bacillus tuaregi]|uniref:response regulator transcription factor n=1 Tax=Bacillus tuaregi TaxID=1816695 RepID=UPI0028FC8162|nr:response regulator transcription factor [Bacillus tuaregi]